MKNTVRISVLSLCLFIVSGCASVPPTFYYTFPPEFQPISDLSLSHYDIVLAVGAFDADLPYQQDRIVFRTSPYEVNFYEYHRWLRPPQDFATERTLHLASASGLFKHVHPYAFETYSDYVLQGTIKLFDQWKISEQTTEAKVGINYELLRADDGSVIWTTMVYTTVELDELTMVELIQSFEAALHDNILQALTMIENVLRQDE